MQNDDFPRGTFFGIPDDQDQETKTRLRACRETLNLRLTTWLPALFAHLDEALQKLSMGPESGSLGADAFDAMRDLHHQRETIELGVKDRILAGFEHLRQAKPRDEAEWDYTYELQLVEEAELEESLILASLISRVEQHHRAQLVTLNRRFTSLRPDCRFDNQNNPLAPAAICHAFRSTLKAASLPRRSRLLIYRLLERPLLDFLQELSQEIDIHLEQTEALSIAARRRRTQPVTATIREDGRRPGEGPRLSRGGGGERIGGSRPAGFGTPSNGKGSEERDPFPLLSALLHQRRNQARAAAPYPASRETLEPISTEELLHALTRLQERYSSLGLTNGEAIRRAGRRVQGELNPLLRLQTSSQRTRCLAEQDLDILDVIGMMFDFLLEDRNIPYAMKSLLSRLQIPVIKATLSDIGFFRSKDHPVRRVLNNLSQLATTWSDDGDRSEDSLFGRIETWVNRLIMESGRNSESFRQLDLEILAYMEREQTNALATEERTCQIGRGKEQLRLARRQVKWEIESRLADHPDIPEALRFLIQDAWRDVLLLAHLRAGPEGEAWHKSLRVLDDLLWSVEIKTTQEERQRLLHLIPDLLIELRAGLKGIAYDPHKMTEMLKELQKRHISCLRGSRSTLQGGDSGDGTEPKTGPPGGPPLVKSAEPAFPGGAALSEPLGIGHWIEIVEASGQRTRAKLAWKSEACDIYIFVNRKGVQVAELSTKELGSLLEKGQAEILREVDIPIVERSIVAMMKTLKETGEAIQAFGGEPSVQDE